MGKQFTTTAQSALPAAADGVTVTPSGSAWTSSSWVQIVASAVSDFVLVDILSQTLGMTSLTDAEIDIGVGGAGSEVVIATISTRGESVIGGRQQKGHFPFAIGIDAIPASSRVAARVRLSSTSTTTWSVSISVIAKPITGVFLTTANPTKCLPSAAGHVDLGTTAGGWANGSWIQLTASAAADLVVAAVSHEDGSTSGENELDIGVGGAGSETVVTTIRSSDWSGKDWNIELSNPLDAIASGSRVAMRCRRSSGSFHNFASMTYWEKPL